MRGSKSAVGLGIACLVAAASVAGCGGGSSSTPRPSSPPVISNLTYSPRSVAQQPGGTASVGATFDFTDPGADVTTVKLAVSDSNGIEVGSGTAAVQGASGQTSGTVHVMVTVKADNAGLYTARVSASDQGGSTSNVLEGLFRISVAANLAPIVTATKPGLRKLQAAAGFLYWSEQDQNVIKRMPVRVTSAVFCSASSRTSFAMPKSRSFTAPSPVTRMLPGFKSR